ncbi:hypothetical protein ACFQS2_02220 [Brachybacterium sp. GCM10030267]|uniref:hypothetical protein n=1 Tax=unclassified Brachybacterium TaxID=2623841 RepID=UPI00361E7E46
MGAVTAAVGVHEVPRASLAAVPVAAPGYADEFALELDVPPRASAESWARAMFGDIPDTGERVIFRGLLRLRLEPGPSPDVVAGFVVAERNHETIRLEAHSPFLTCHLLVRTHALHVTLTTVMDYTGRAGPVVWSPLSMAHRRLAPGLLRDAQEKLSSP